MSLYMDETKITLKKQTAENKHSINHNNGIEVHVHEHDYHMHQGCGYRAVPLEEEGKWGTQHLVPN